MKRNLLLSCLTVLLTLLAAAVPAHAQATRTWVSGVGDDANPCSRTAPCKTFAGAISKTASGGEINVLDPGGFGAVTITKPITISSEGFEAGVLVSGTNGIVVNVPNATDVVVLRGLDIEGLGTGINGITILTGGTVQVEKCTIEKFTGFGINFTPTVNGSQLHVVDTIVRNNGSGVNGGGILVSPSSGTSKGSLDNVRLENNVLGIRTQATGTGASNTSVFRSVAASNANAGFASATGGTLTVERSIAAHNGTGIGCASGAVRIGNTSITDNGTAVSTGGTCESFKNNDIVPSTIIGGLTPINPQ
jgi:hypothetical protein